MSSQNMSKPKLWKKKTSNVQQPSTSKQSDVVNWRANCGKTTSSTNKNPACVKTKTSRSSSNDWRADCNRQHQGSKKPWYPLPNGQNQNLSWRKKSTRTGLNGPIKSSVNTYTTPQEKIDEIKKIQRRVKRHEYE